MTRHNERQIRKLEQARQIAKKLNLNYNSLDISERSGKRFKILTPQNKYVHFGLFPFNKYGTFLDHGDEKIRENWKKRHSQIKDKNGNYCYKNPESAEFYSYNILW